MKFTEAYFDDRQLSNIVVAAYLRLHCLGVNMSMVGRFSILSYVCAVATASGFINFLHLSGSLFMLEVYDRVLPSKSIPTLIALCVLVLALYAFQALFDILRTRIMNRTASLIDDRLGNDVFQAIRRAPLTQQAKGDPMQPLVDLDNVRSFLSGQGPHAFFDFPWLPIYLVICFLLHPYIGLTVCIGAVILVGLTFLTEWSTRHVNEGAAVSRGRRNAFVTSSLRNAEVIKAMGMSGPMASAWRNHQGGFRDQAGRAADIVGVFATSSRAFRMALQSGVMAVGAYLVIMGEASAGSIIAGSILSAKALAPVEIAIANWRSFTAAREGWKRLNTILSATPRQDIQTTLPLPSRSLSVENVAGGPPSGRVTVAEVSFSLEAGDALGVIGPSGSGKSTLARLIIGVWQHARGDIRLDGATLEQWDDADIGRCIGYLPQTIELLPGTIAENISRFQPNASSQSIIAAAKAAGVHDLIVTLPKGYDTRIGDGGEMLSVGQMQRVALARALFGDPFIVVLDEPNSNLDREGELALSGAIASVRARNGIVIVIAHRPSALENVNLVMVMAFGRVQHFGPKSDMIRSSTSIQPGAAEAESKGIVNASA